MPAATARVWPSRWLVLLCAAAALLFAPKAFAAEPGTNADLTWGISSADQDRTVSLMKDAGVKWVRLNISWKSVEPNSKGSYSSGYLSNIDSIVDKVRAAGIQVVMPMADSVPYWASADPSKYTDSSGTKHWNVYWRPTSFNDYGDAFRYVVNRYSAHGVHVYEVWNEPNLKNFWPSGPNATEYVQMLKAAYPAAKGADPSSTILAGALSDNDYGFLQGIYAAGGGPYFDAVSDHTYPNAGPDSCWNDSAGKRNRFAFCAIEEIRNTMVANGDSAKQIWLTEFGWSTCDNSFSGCWGKGVSESDQATYTTEAFRDLESYPYVKAALEYNFRNTYFRNDDPGDFSADLGLLRTDFTPKPAYAAFQAYATGSQPPSTDPPPTTDPPPPTTDPPPSTDPPPATDPPATDAPPTIRLTSPSDGLVFDRSLALSADAADDHGVAKIEFLVDGAVVGTDSSAPYALTWRAPQGLAYSSHVVEARAVDTASQVAVDSATVTRARKSKLTLAVQGTAHGYSTSGPSRVVSGQVLGASGGSVVIRIQRRAGSHWSTKAVSRPAVSGGGAYSARLGALARGRWRARAVYVGTEQSPPSLPRTRSFKVR
jgi:polysaccharide biosynthesis protein PslG